MYAYIIIILPDSRFLFPAECYRNSENLNALCVSPFRMYCVIYWIPCTVRGDVLWTTSAVVYQSQGTLVHTTQAEKYIIAADSSMRWVILLPCPALSAYYNVYYIL